MPFLPILIIEIFSALFVSSLTPSAVVTIKHSLHQVLPLVFAQEESTPIPTDQPSVGSSDSQSAQPPNSPSDSSSQPAASDQSGPANASSTIDQSQNPSDTTSISSPDQSQPTTTNNDSTLLNDINSQAQQGPTEAPQTNQSSDQTSPSEQPSQSNSSGSDSSQSFSVISDEPAVSQASTTVLNSNDIIGGPAETVDKKSVEMSQKQDEQIAKANTPAETATLSIDFAKDSVREVEHNIRSDDFSTASFVTQRLSDQVDTALEQSQKVGSKNLSNQLKSFCKQADLLLRSQQLAVPEEGEQDFEIIRGKCLDIVQ